MNERDRAVLRLLSYPARATEAVLADLAEAFLGGAAAVNWAEVGRLSVMEPAPEGALLMHALMRDALQAREITERPDLCRRVHARLLERFLAEARPEAVGLITAAQEMSLLSTLDHLFAAREAEWVKILAAAVEPFQGAQRSALLESLFDKVLGLVEHDRWFLEVLELRRARAQAIGMQGRDAAAEVELRAVYKIQRRPEVLGEDHPFTLSARANIAQQMGAQGRHAAAEAEFRAVYEILRRPEVRGENHHFTLATRHNIAQQMGALGRHAAAEAEFRAIYEVERRPEVLGEAHRVGLRG